ncbi:hypothetical protein JRG42_17075 [Pseudomonas granadensis]|uniref:hypothetical protein n=1 Tax=Pseudomonas granadensis TaxID=1421430 RepID=UPI0019D29132|nr:hypothetical protein [Pseudomonas granadensis]MBN6772573.1 hypothetical protein [Pseudomonas granadensis]MBN6805894.1 hypothetical protein [Pseudomonas granadensis]MBN6831066.1 hypothetical protein [Pseudomonas granadensis]MBN6840385.1 hypothetical protein [Pseudomonas granadensis]MBN6867970.1 hypothetical protein [Pseudomonas granadensis]
MASVTALVLPTQAVSHSSSGNNSPVISGNGNNVSYQSGFPDLETIRAERPNISDQQYAAIKPGMTYEQVLDIVKIPRKEAVSGGNVQVYTWDGGVRIYSGDLGLRQGSIQFSLMR